MSAKQPLFAFFGTPRFAVDVLRALESRGMLPAVVVTAPDRPRGRGLEVTPSPAKAWALERGIEVLTPATLKDEDLVAELKNNDWDVFVVAAYAKLIPQEMLDIPRRGCLNIHPSLLPKFRGPSPARSAILADVRSTGVTVMLMTASMDAGPIVAQGRIELEEETADTPGWPPQGEMFEQLLATEGGNLLAEILPDWIEGNITPAKQDESQATFTKKFTTEDALVDLQGDPRQQLLKIRALDKNPRAYFIDGSKRVGITEGVVEGHKLIIKKVVPEGKKEMSWEEYQRGQR